MRGRGCPDPGLISRFFERRLGRRASHRILVHAANCTPCRRLLAVGTLSPSGPLWASLGRRVTPERVTVAAAALLLPMILWILGEGDTRSPAPARTALSRRLPAQRVTHSSGPTDSGQEVDDERGPDVRQDPADEPSRPTLFELPGPLGSRGTPAEEAPRPLERTLTVAAPGDPAQIRTEAGPPPAAPPGSRNPTAFEAEVPGRLAILDPFGSLALEASGGRLAIGTSSVVPADGRLLAIGRASGFRLADGLKVQLTAGSSVSVFHSPARRCAGLTLHQGALLVESAQLRSLVLGRDERVGVLEGLTGQLHLSTGARPGELSVSPMAGGSVWRRPGEPDLELGAGDQLSVRAESQELARRGSRPRPVLSRFIPWPEPGPTLYYASFDPDVQGVDHPAVLQGSQKGDCLAAVVLTSRKRVIELGIPAALLSTPNAVIRLRFRTTATRIQCGPSRSAPPSVPVRAHSATEWTWVSFPLGASNAEGLRDGGRERHNRMGLTITVEGPARVAAEDLTFDLDQVEVLRS